VIVLDASAVVELLLNTATGRTIAARIADPAVGIHIPHLTDVEVMQALRRYTRDRDLDPVDAAAAVDNLRALDLLRHPHEPFLDRVWELRDNLSAYDAVYVALAEVLDAELLTCDGRVARASGTTARIELVKPAGLRP
jgi:predicted nucleic acid-binding protein